MDQQILSVLEKVLLANVLMVIDLVVEGLVRVNRVGAGDDTGSVAGL